MFTAVSSLGNHKVVPVLNKAPRHEDVLGSCGMAPRIKFGARWRWVVSFTPRPLYYWERTPDTHRKGGWVGPRAGLDAMVKRKIPSPTGNRTPVFQPVASRCSREVKYYVIILWKDITLFPFFMLLV